MTTKVVDMLQIVDFHFSDGTYLRVEATDWDWNNGTFRFEYYYALDENGDVIPLNPADYTPDGPINPNVALYLENNGFMSTDSASGQPFVWDSSKVTVTCSITGGEAYCEVTRHP